MLNKALIRLIWKKTPYELFKEKKPNISYFKIFGCSCFILINGKDKLEKFDAKSDERIFLGYSSHSRAYRVFNKRILILEELMYVIFYETNSLKTRKEELDMDAKNLEKKLKDMNIEDTLFQEKEDVEQDVKEEEPQSQYEQGTSNLPNKWRYDPKYLKKLIIGDPSYGIKI